MNRRRFVAGALTLFAAPLRIDAQTTAGKIPRVGLVVTTTPLSEMAGPKPVHPLTRAFVERLRELGYVEDQTVVIERRSAEGKFDRFDDIIAELLRLDVSVIVTTGNAMTKRAKKLTATVPIVMGASWTPVEDGLVSSLARPGVNVTGLSVDVGPDIEAKRLTVLVEAVPGVARVAVLGMKADWATAEDRSLRTAAAALGVTLLRAEHTPNDYGQAFELISRGRPDALFVVKNPPNYAQRDRIIEFAERSRLPATYPTREFVDIGGLMTYGISVVDLYRRAAEYVDRILRGAKPADLPVEQPVKFDLVINLTTARALGLTIPPSLLLRADQVIE